MKPTKVPAMRKNQPYLDWKKELHLWQVTNSAIGVQRKVLGGVLYQSLEGIARDAVLSELTVEEMSDDEHGVSNIIKTLDHFFIGNETQNSYNAMDDLIKFKCTDNQTLEAFIIEFHIKVNKVKASGTVLHDGVLGYTLLNSANLSQDKHDMVKATCDELTFNNVKAQLEKIGFEKSRSKYSKYVTSTKIDTHESKVKLEKCLYGESSPNQYRETLENSSDEDLNGEHVYYSENRALKPSGSKFKMNPTDRFGHVRPCTYCKCLYHWLADCQYAPSSVKSDLRSKSMQDKTKKVL